MRSMLATAYWWHQEWLQPNMLQTGYKFSSINVCEGFLLYAGQTELLTKNYGKRTGQEPVLEQVWIRKWNWLGQTLRRNDDSITKQALQWTLQVHRGRGRPRNTWKKRSGERNVDSRIQVQLEEDGGVNVSAQDRAGWRHVVCGLCSTGSNKA